MRLKQELLRLFEIKEIAWERLLKLFVFLGLVFIVLVVFLSPWKVLAFLLGVILLGFVYARPTWVVAFLAIFIAFEPFALKFVPDELYLFAKYFSEGLIYLLLAAVTFRRFLENTKRPSTPLDLPFLLLVLAALVSSIANLVSPTIAFLGIRQIIRFPLLFFAVASLGPSRKFIRKLAIIVLAIVMLESALGLAQSLTQGALDPFLLPSARKVYDAVQVTGGTDQFWAAGTRVFGTLGRYDQLGTFLCFFLLLVVGWLYDGKTEPRERKLLWLLMILGGGALALTFSRASWFGFLLGFVWMAVRIKKDKRVVLALAALAIIAVSYIAYSGIVVKYLVESPRQTLVQRFFEAFSYERYRGEYYGLGRVYWFVQTPLKVVAHSPIFGWGPGTYGGGAAAALRNTHVYDALGIPYGVYGTDGYIDNNWFSLWGELGTLGIAIYIWMFVALWRVARIVREKSKDRLIRGIGLAFQGCILALTLQAFLGTYLEVRTIALYFWMFAALMVVEAQREGILKM